MDVKVKLSADPERSVSVPIDKTDQGGATSQDYAGVPQKVTFTTGDMEETITFAATQDSYDDDGESVVLGFGILPTGVSTGSTGSATVTITDDDDPTVTASFGQGTYSVAEGGTVQVTVTLNADPEREVAIRLIHGLFGGISDADYSGVPVSLVFQSSETEKSFTFTAAADDIDDDGESVALTFRTPMPRGVTAGATTTVTITDDDERGVAISKTALEIDEGDSATYTVKLNTQPTEDLTVAIAGQSGTDITLSGATLTGDALTFTSDNWDTAQTVTVSAARDSDATSDAAVTLTHTANGGDYVDVKETLTVTIVEKDTGVLSVGDAGAAEDGGNVVFTVRISAANGEAVTVGYATSDGTATAGRDYTETSGTLTFPANSAASRNVSVPVTDDAADEAEEETFTLTLSNVQGASLAGGGSTLTATGAITDNDDPTVTASFGQTDYSVDEGGTVTIKVQLSADPERRVTIPLTTANQSGASDSDHSGAPASVVFQNGDTEKSFSFTAVQDSVDDDGESVKLGFGTLPTSVTAGSTDETVVSITDDDDPTVNVRFENGTYTVAEGGTQAIKITLNVDPERTITFPLTRANQDGATSADYTVTASVTFKSGETEKTITFAAAQDTLDDDGESVKLGFGTMPTGAFAVNPTQATVSITDDDDPQVTISFASAMYRRRKAVQSRSRSP